MQHPPLHACDVGLGYNPSEQDCKRMRYAGGFEAENPEGIGTHCKRSEPPHPSITRRSWIESKGSRGCPGNDAPYIPREGELTASPRIPENRQYHHIIMSIMYAEQGSQSIDNHSDNTWSCPFTRHVIDHGGYTYITPTFGTPLIV